MQACNRAESMSPSNSWAESRPPSGTNPRLAANAPITAAASSPWAPEVEAFGVLPFAEPLALAVAPQRHMAIAGRRRPQGRHHGHLGAGGTPEILAAHHVADPEGQLINGRRQVVGHHPIGPPQHPIPHRRGPLEAAGGGEALRPAERSGG